MSEPTTTSADWTRVYEALASDTRRAIVRYLRTSTASTSVDAVAAHVADEAAWQADRPLDGNTTRLGRIRTRLYHVHLPKLVDAGLLRWDETRDSLALTEAALSLPVGVLTPDGPSAGLTAEASGRSD